jgi:hypothetical protein
MRHTAIIFLVILSFFLLAPGPASASRSEGDYEIEFKGTVGEELDKVDVDQLLDKVSAMLQKYKAAEEDVEQLTEATTAFIQTVNGYAKKIKASETGTSIPAPHEELKAYCSKLGAFLETYKVSVEDTLDVGRIVAYVAMSIKEVKDTAGSAGGNSAAADDMKKTIASKEDINAVFLRLMEFSKKHKIMACDLVPVIYRLCDIGLTLMQNRVNIEQVKQAGGRWRKRLYDLGVSKEQADALYDELKAFTYKYKITLLEIVRLNKDIQKLLKSKSGPKE